MDQHPASLTAPFLLPVVALGLHDKLDEVVAHGVVALHGPVAAARFTWTSGTAVRYQWYRTGVAIKGGSGKTYKLTSADVGKAMSVGITGYKAGYTSLVKYSARTTAVTR